MSVKAIMSTLLLTAPPLLGQICTPEVIGSCDLTVAISSGTLSSFSQAQFYAATCGPGAEYMDGEHLIDDEYGMVLDQLAWGVQSGYYSGTRSGVGSVGACYTAHNVARAYPAGYPPGQYTPPINGGPWISSCQCVANRDPQPPPCFDADPSKCTSPIILNLGHGGYRLTSVDDSVSFDLNADGVREHTAWTAAGALMSFLALDRNSNGVVDDGSELFGDHTALSSGGVAGNGFLALAEFDANADRVIDARDPIWRSLLLWTDVDHDGVTQRTELRPIATSGVEALELEYRWTGRRDANGNILRYGALLYLDGETRTYYDIYFGARP